MVLLNTFLPVRLPDMTLGTLGLYLIWYLYVGIFGAYIPEWPILRYMVPTIEVSTIRGYCAPFVRDKTKASVRRFGHIIPFLPDAILKDARSKSWWKTAEGLLGAKNFSNINAQA